MKPRMFIWILAFSLGLNIVLVAGAVFHFSHQPAPEPPERHHGGPPPFTHILRFDENRLNLRSDQRQKIEAIRERWEHQEWRARRETMERMTRLGGLLVRDNLTTAALAPLYDDVRAHSTQFFSRLATALSEYRAVLDPQQDKVFTQLLQERFNELQSFVRGHLGRYQRWERKQKNQPAAPVAEKRGH